MYCLYYYPWFTLIYKGNQDDFDKDGGNGCNKVNEINERECKGNVSRTCGKTYQASKN